MHKMYEAIQTIVGSTIVELTGRDKRASKSVDQLHLTVRNSGVWDSPFASNKLQHMKNAIATDVATQREIDAAAARAAAARGSAKRRHS